MPKATQPPIYEDGGVERPMFGLVVARAHQWLEEMFLHLCVPFSLIGSYSLI
jgi:hypothetical protein